MEKAGGRRSVRKRGGVACGSCLVTHGEKERLAQSLVKRRPEELGSISGIHRVEEGSKPSLLMAAICVLWHIPLPTPNQ